VATENSTSPVAKDKPSRTLVILPNLLTAYRFLAAPFLVILMTAARETGTQLLIFTVFLSAALTDMADGYVARKFKTESVLGKLMDPLADKVLVVAPLIMLLAAGDISAWLCFFLIAREITVTGFRGLAAARGLVVAASGLGKMKSIFIYTGLGILLFPLELVPLPFLRALGILTLQAGLFISIWSGCDYFFKLRKIFLDSE